MSFQGGVSPRATTPSANTTKQDLNNTGVSRHNSSAGYGSSADIDSSTVAAAASPPEPTAAELREAHPQLFNVQHLGFIAGLQHRWRATSAVGRVACIGLMACMLAAVVLAAGWATDETLAGMQRRDSADGVEIARAMLSVERALRDEQAAALALAALLWSKATPDQVELRAPPSVTAITDGSADATAEAFHAASEATDAALSYAVRAMVDRSQMASKLLGEDVREAAGDGELRAELLLALRRERRFVVGNRGTRNPATSLDRLRRKTMEDATTAVRQFSQDDWAGLSLTNDPEHAWLTAGATGLYAVRQLRSRVYPTCELLPETIVARYAALQADVLRLSVRAAFGCEYSLVTPLFRAAMAASAAALAADAHEGAQHLLNAEWRASVSDATIVSVAVAFAGAYDGYRMLVETVFPAVMSDTALRSYRFASQRTNGADVMATLRESVVQHYLDGPALDGTLDVNAFVHPAGAEVAAALSATLDASFPFPSSTSSEGLTTSRYLAMTVCVGLLAVLLAIVLVWEQRRYAALVVSGARDRGMEATIEYVASVGECIRSFDLEGAAAHTTRHARDATTRAGVAVVHDRLLRCVASLRYLAASLPPYLFPEAAASAARYYSVVRQSTPAGGGSGLVEAAREMGGASAGLDGEGHGAGSDKELLTLEQVASAGLDEDIANRVMPAIEKRFGVFLWLDLSTLLEFRNSTVALDVAKEYVPLVAAVAEEAIVMHGGVFHSQLGLALMGSWGIPDDADVPDQCEAAARAAFALSAQLRILRRSHAAFESRFNVSVAITAGDVRYMVSTPGPNFGFAHAYGPPILRAPAVLRSNYHHLTSIALDDVAAELLGGRQLLSKPVELLSTAFVETAKSDGPSRPGGAGAGGGGAGAGGGAGGAVGSETAGAAGSSVPRKAYNDVTEGRAHELISLARLRDPDLAGRLAEYKSAFVLYQRGYHAEALKGFRRYTKLYGYDGSVERIQSLMLL